MHQVRSFPQQVFAFAQRFPYQIELPVFQVTQSAMDDARGTAGYPGSKIVLFHQQRVLPSASALPRHGHAVDAPADHHHLKVLVPQGRSWISC
jgi:hypothetical protein